MRLEVKGITLNLIKRGIEDIFNEIDTFSYISIKLKLVIGFH